MSKPMLQSVDWPTLTAWIDSLASEQGEFDSIVGVGLGGIPLAITLAYRCPLKTFAMAYKLQNVQPRVPFYVFEGDRAARFSRTCETMTLTECSDLGHVLVIDDVVTFGDTLTAVDRLLARTAPESVQFACYGADIAVLSCERPEISNRLKYAIAIDNSSVWLTFPWHRD